MANNKIQIKRTSISGATPNTTNSSNSAYIRPGELAVNMADKKIFTANTSGGLIELGSNIYQLAVTSVYANGSVGTPGQLLASNGSVVYWTDTSAVLGYTGSKGDIGYTGSKGDTGLGFNIAKIYGSVAELQADTSPTGIVPGEFALIDTGDIDDLENARLYLWDGSVYIYVTDLSGATGIQGPRGDTGYDGSFGYTGSKGDTGYDGSFGYTGSKGDIGYTGSLGYTGSKGDTGFDGSKGDIGYTGSKGFTGSKGDIGYTGSLGNIGYTGSLGFTGSKGDIGYTGSKGDIGFTGSLGFTGSKGDTGFNGSKGDTGFTGSLGYTGSKGDTGFNGSKGDTGFTGSKGDTGLGFNIAKTYSSVAALLADTSPTGIVAGEFAIIETGNNNDPENSRLYLWNGSVYTYTSDLSGAAGITGAQGAIGYTGSKGDTGFNGSVGFTGSKGDIGYTGSKGDTGFNGSVGFTGSLGYTGSQGAQGVTGFNGSVGYTGSLGYTGSKGDIGFTGSKGDIGYAGSVGYTGSLGYTGSTGYSGSIGTASIVEISDTPPSSPTVGQFWWDSSVAQLKVYYDDGTSVQWVDASSGLQGAQGVAGYNGSIGYTGSLGFTGSKGDTGFVGSKGDFGYTGSLGATGAQGAIGYTGSKGDTGFNGSVGFTGSKGDTGFDGSVGAQGAQGAIGYTGSLGFTGSKGDIGYTGSKGDTGLGFSIVKSYVSVAALTADTSPTGIVAGQFAIIETGDNNNPENSRLYLWNGSAYSYVSDLSGAAGVTGAQGAIGYTGSKGDTGFNGSVGAQGAQGVIGYTGSKGDTGFNGSVGFTGSKGDIGFTGSLGYTGSKGDTGFNGSKGDTGFTGSKGDTGYNGSVGAQGAQGVIGYTGSALMGAINWSQNSVSTSQYANTADSYPKALASVTITTSGSPVQISAYGDANPLTGGSWGKLALARGSTILGSNVHFESSAANENNPFGLTYIDNPSAGTYTYYLYCTQTSGGNMQFGESTGPTISVVELQNVKGYGGSVGAQGAQGVIGYTGSQGAQGVTGYNGSVGAQGAQGVIGYTGSLGAQGATGYNGSVGAQGATGYNGSVGAQGPTGYNGSVGAQGPTGYNGSVGAQGPIGYTGSLGYTGSKGDIGFTGSLGYTGSKGDIGYTGSKGDIGYTGSLGFTGSKGDIGYTGSLGFTGSKGDIGYTGSLGYTGSKGDTPESTIYTAQSISLTGGVYVSGALSDIQTFSDGNAYVITDGSGSAPAWHIDVGFTGVTSFNQVDVNVNYTASSGHTIYIQLYNYDTTSWDSVGSYSGLGSYNQFQLGVISPTPYISSGEVTVRLYHSNGGNTGHQTSLDYVVIVDSISGGQGPRGYTGYTGSKGDIGYTGSKGDIGYTGSQGEIGYTGSKGDTGYTGSQPALEEIALEVASLTGDVHGVYLRSESQLYMDDSTRTFKIAPTGSSWQYYYHGNLHTVSSNASIVLANTSGSRFIRLDPATDTLVEGGPVPNFKQDLIVSYIYFNANTQETVVLGDERHGYERDTTWHSNQHLNVGTVWRSGGSLTYTLNNDASVQIGVGTPLAIADEDLLHTITHSASPSADYEQILTTAANLEVLYLDGAYYRATAANTTPWVAGTSLARYNQVTAGSGSLVDANEGEYITYWLLATNDIRRPVKLVMGRASHASIDDAYAEEFQEYGLSFAEQVFMYQIVVKTSSAYTGNSAKIQIAAVRKVTSKVASVASNVTAASHENLTGRDSADQHPIGAITGLQANLDSKQVTLVSGTNIKTINGNSILGSGNINEVGYTGSKGDIGYTGSKGDTGFNGSVGFTGSKGDTGYDGSVGFTGSRGVIGYTGSQGDIGYTGSKGDIGYTGSKGFDGSVGAQGPIGYTGSKGFDGSVGAQGPIGYTGSKGFDGSVGAQGAQGDIGYTGSKGFDGSVGAQGPIGYTGSKGFDGSVGAQGPIGYTGSKGFDGSVGAQGPIGYTGSKGFDGSVGAQGPIGYTGSKGDIGYTGSKGFDGSVGAQGPIGYTGSVGYDGSVGGQGPIGAQGPQGTTGYTGSLGYTGSKGTTYLGNTAPSSPASGDTWWNSDTGIRYVYYTDTNSSQWVQESAIGPMGPAGYTGSSGGGGGGSGVLDYSFSNVATSFQSGTSEVLIPDMACSFTLGSTQDVHIQFSCLAQRANPGGGAVRFILKVDGSTFPGNGVDNFYSIDQNENRMQAGNGSWIINLASGSHTIEIWWNDALSVLNTAFYNRYLLVKNLT